MEVVKVVAGRRVAPPLDDDKSPLEVLWMKMSWLMRQLVRWRAVAASKDVVKVEVGRWMPSPPKGWMRTRFVVD